MRKLTLTLLPIFLVALACSAQIQTIVVNGHKQDVYSYDQAVKALTSHIDEFGVKGELEELPTLGDQLRHARQAQNLTWTDLSDKTGLSESIIEKIERNMVTPTRDLLAKIEEVIGTELILTVGQ
jgi:ribosome-binding protein aMBF1 (putative translation factor)